MKFKELLPAGLFVVGLLLVIKFADIGYPLHVSVSNRSAELAVVGEGKVEVSPDIAYVDVGVTVNSQPTVEVAQNKLKETNNNIVEALKKIGIDEKNIKTINYSVYPNYSYENSKSTIAGYDGTATVSVKTRDTEQVSTIIETATNAGANQVNNTRMVVESPEKYREEAREKAIQNAKDQANKLAKSLNIKLGKVTNMVESTGGGGALFQGGFAAREMGGGGGPALEAGTETVTSVVTLYFEKK